MYKTKLGKAFNCDSLNLLNDEKFKKKYLGKVDLIITSPPFPLIHKKKYGNEVGHKYIEWLGQFSNIFKNYIKPKGSIVIEVGNSWTPGKPTFSLITLKSLINFLETGNLKLAQEFVWYNPAKLPTPAAWVTIKRIRVKDSFTKIWWMSKNFNPKASNKKVLISYSKKMEQLLKSQKYNHGKRISGHSINKTSFLSKNKGSIPSNVLMPSNVLPFSNTGNAFNKNYIQYCKKKNLTPHPALMQNQVIDFFINFLTNKNDLIMDPFAGSNTTGQVAESLSRKWISIEKSKEYLKGSIGRFENVIKT